jgi:putative transposase
MLEASAVSERRACRLAGLSRDAFGHPPEPAPETQALSARIIELAQVRRRFGYRRLHDLLRPEYPTVNHKKVYRLYREANLAVRRRKKIRRPPGERQALAAAAAPNAVWSMDFVSDALANGRRLKCLTVADDFTHECVNITVDHGISGTYVVRVLDRMLATDALDREPGARREVNAHRQHLARLVETNASNKPRRCDAQCRFEQPVMHGNRSCSSWPMRQHAASSMTSCMPAGSPPQGFAAPG